MTILILDDVGRFSSSRRFPGNIFPFPVLVRVTIRNDRHRLCTSRLSLKQHLPHSIRLLLPMSVLRSPTVTAGTALAHLSLLSTLSTSFDLNPSVPVS